MFHVDFVSKGYGPNVLSHGFYPLKFDLGGLLLGAMFGLGALLFIPKLIHILIPELAAYGHYAGAPFGRSRHLIFFFQIEKWNHRYNISLDSDVLPQGANEIVSQFEKVLSQYNINSSECMQKAICTYVQSSHTSHNRNSRAEHFDSNNMTDNTIR